MGESIELTLTGAAAEELRFPLPPWDTEVIFIPCCNLIGGILQMVQFPVNPEKEPFPESFKPISPFIKAIPDEMVRATAGLNIEFRYKPEQAGAEGLLKVLRWTNSGWEAVFEPEIDDTAHVVRFSCPNGGTFVLVTAAPEVTEP